ncbi:transmembrane protease serine 2-like [Synchiropus picturatus]
MNSDRDNPPVYDNIGFQLEEATPPPYSPPQSIYPALPQETPSYVVVPPHTINTHQSLPIQAPPYTAQIKAVPARRGPRWNYIICVTLSVLVALAVIGLLLWYFLYYQCVMGMSCGAGGGCLSASQWCDGVKDCTNGKDESHCFRLHGTNFMLQGYSKHSQSWRTVCAENWNNNYGREVCGQMGYSRNDYVASSQTSSGSSTGFLKLRPKDHHGSSVMSQLEESHVCTTGAIKLQCIECGKSIAAPRNRIVGGTDAVKGAWPWQVSLQVRGQHICGGSIIAPYWIVSAAHCFQTYSSPHDWTVKYGEISQSVMDFTIGKSVYKIINHEKYDPDSNDNDITLLKLRSPLTFTDNVRPVCLPNFGADLSPERQAWITGWGALYSSGPSPDTLNQAEVTMYKTETCNRRDILNGALTEAMICAGKLAGGVDSCQGDSGGPLVVKEAGLWWLVGDTSWGYGCAARKKPGVYGNVSHFIEWIHTHMQNQ